jgi:hypothetical protein
MRIPLNLSLTARSLAVGCLALLIPAAAIAAGGPTPTPSPKPDAQKKVWTTEDVERLNPEFDPARPKRASAAAVATPVASAPSALPGRVLISPSAPLAPQQDPAWYAQQLDSLDAELSGIDSHIAELRQFRATSSGLPTGLVISAPCEGITTDNLISQLDARRQEILQQIDDLGDVARQNGMAPGILVVGRGRADTSSQPTPEELRAAIVERAREAASELAEVRGTVTDMQDGQAAQRMTLLQPIPGQGGNMTTDLLDQLYTRADALQSEISNSQDAARTLGVPPGDLR